MNEIDEMREMKDVGKADEVTEVNEVNEANKDAATFIPVETKDGSVTFYNAKAREHYHTLTGAIEEAELKHLAPAKEYIKTDCVVCDFCFGLGYNAFVTIAEAVKKNCAITVYALENDLNVMLALGDITIPEPYDSYRQLFLKLFDDLVVKSVDVCDTESGEVLCKKYQLSEGLVTFILFLGDARKTLSLIPKDSVDIFYFDPFSLRKTPEMWAESVFALSFSVMKKKSIMTTYSCSKVVRRNMALAGFHVIDGPVVGRIAPGTLALKN